MVEEVATALLDASRRLSTDSGFSRGQSWSSNLSSSQSEVSDQAGSLPKQGGIWFGGLAKRSRTISEGEGTSARFDIGGWFSGFGKTLEEQTGAKSNDFQNDSRHRVRRSSSKDVEEAMAGGTNRVGIYMPPI